jgi:hypothetical protein
VFDWSAYGSECCDTAWDEFGIDCATLESTHGWDCAGCSCPGDGEAECGDGTDAECTSCSDTGQVECWDGSCADSADDCPEQPEVETPAICAEGTVLYDAAAITTTWFVETVCGDGICNGDEDY